ncbi:Deoxyfructose oxidoreductase protein [Halorhabdus tiamatea SARL4B]|uniref:Deoxyfructose oxidoreductase protein n=1 Tax=Halorhabdus tiamatea SARL4B TaxID=1033806 RepID=U2E701_9EURY|nr:Gfo/Idh/MocA family oxidoreductase [Halorhabdus tiamatea]ERJ07671.1 Deoxyfructose oxidoreductase protein [Halorhabdus tiamatea SARL4B]
MRFGILSTAGIARNAVIPAIERSEHEVTAIASRDADRAETVASELGIPNAYGSYDEMLADAPIDAVYNPLPNALHAEWTIRAADAGHDVLCEKPIGVDAEQAREMYDYCDRHDVTLMEAFMYRFHPRTERAAEVVAENLENVRAGSATFTFSLRGNPDDIRLDPDLAGGSLMDLGCYAVSAMRLFLGEPERVYAKSVDTRDAGVDSQLTGILEFESGATARIQSGFDTPFAESYRVEAENGWLEAENVFGADPDQPVEIEYEVGGRHVTEAFDPVDPYQREVEHFADAVESGSTPRIDGTESAHNMAVIDALYESAKRGEPVSLS